MAIRPPDLPPPSPNDVLYEKLDGFARITLNRPLVLNAVDWSVLRHLHSHLVAADEDDDVRAVILTGAGRAFSAGGDMAADPEPDDGVKTPGIMDIVMRIWNMPKPVIASVTGHAVGQGIELAGACDLTVAADDAKFGEIQIRHGFGPPILITPFLVGLKQAKELLLLGEILTAEEALRIGLVNRVVPKDTLVEETEAIARKLASLPYATVRLNKMLVNRAYELAGMRAALDYAADPAFQQLFGATRDDAESQARFAVLRDQGWEAFIRERDRLYRDERT